MAGIGGKQGVMLDAKSGKVASAKAEDDSTVIAEKVVGAHDPTLESD